MGRGSIKKSKKTRKKRLSLRRAALQSAFVLSMANMVTVPPVHAACPGTVTVSAVGGCTLTGTEFLTVTSTGSIDAFGYAATAVFVDNSATGVTINISGSVKGDVGQAGIYIQPLATGTTITNNDGGLISGLSTHGITYSGPLDISLNNSGSIMGNGSKTDTVAGVYIGTDLSGTLTNTSTGAISALAATTATARAIGVYVEDILSGALNNQGTITATANSTVSNSAEAYGVYVFGGDLSGTLTNSDTINAIANASATTKDNSATAFGILINSGNLTDTLTNTSTGTIRATATAVNVSSAALAKAFGVSLLSNGLSGTLDNNGSIHATATATSSTDEVDALAFGVSGNGDLTGSLTNTSATSINASATANGGTMPATATALGIYFNGNISGAGFLANSGAVKANATVNANNTGMTTAKANAGGIVAFDLSSTLSNSSTGSISATARVNGNADNAIASAIALGLKNVSVALTNNGTLTATASAHGKKALSAFAYGLSLNQLTAAFSNTGTISASASASGGTASSVSAVGAYVATLNNTFTNSGTISGTSSVPGKGYSLFFNAGTGAVSNLAGGFLSGNLQIGGTIGVTNSGTIKIPVGAAATIADDFTQSATGVLGFDAFSTASYGTLNVGGTADFTADSGLKVYVAPGATLVDGDTINNIFTAGTLNATTFTVTDDSILFSFAAVKDGNTIDLNVSRMSVIRALNGLGSPAALRLAAIFDDLYTTGGGGMASVLSAFNEVGTAQELLDVLNECLPMIIVNSPYSILSSQHELHRIIAARMDNILEAEQGINSGDTFYGERGIWFKPFGSWAEQDPIDGIAGYDSDSYGFIIGVDGFLNSSAYSQGAAFSYTRSTVNSSPSVTQSATVNSYNGILYGKFKLSETSNLTWQGDAAYHNYDTDRVITLMSTIAHAGYNGWSAHLGLNFENRYDLNERTSLIPSIGMDYSTLHSDSYSETGAGPLNLQVGSNSTDELIVGFNVKLRHRMTEATVSANLGGGYDVIDDSGSITSSFAGDPGTLFTTDSIDPAAWVAKGGLELAFGIDGSMQWITSYDIEVRESFTNQSASLKFKVPF